jgi:hypothetical protein
LLTFALYLRTLAPSVVALFDDSLEFQLVGYKLAIAHPTGYPLYTLLLYLFSYLPSGDVAYRANLLSALCASLAVMFVYLTTLRLTDSSVAACLSALALAISPVFWSQAVITEVYALHALFVAMIVYWRLEVRSCSVVCGLEVGSWKLLAFLLGLGLTHHRTIILLTRNSQFAIRNSQSPNLPISQSLGLFFLPLTLYFYLPLRGHIGSLDGTYENTLTGFWRWVMASDYGNFITANPFEVHYDAEFFWNLFVTQFGWLGLSLSALGMIALLATRHSPLATRHSPRFAAIFLLIVFLTHLAFVLVYKVPDVQVFAIPAFSVMAIALGCGWDEVWRLAHRLNGGLTSSSLFKRTIIIRSVGVTLLFVALLWNFVTIFQRSFTQDDLSGKTDVRAHGRDVLAQAFPPNSTLVGILGEMTLVRYFQTTENLQPTLITIAADKDDERLQTIDRILRQASSPSGDMDASRSAQSGVPRIVFTTRMLAGLSEKYALSAMGPLVRVWQTPPPSDLSADAPRVSSIKYRVENITLAQPHLVRVNIAWEPTTLIADDLKISARMLDGERIVAAQDDWPVHNAYPTRQWRVGTVIHDVYDVPVPRDTPAQTYRVLLIVYRAENGAEVGRIEAGMIEIR